MKPLSISVKILVLAFVNLLLLVLVAGIFARLQFRLDLNSFLLAPARDRILSVSRLIALELPEASPGSWNQYLDHYSHTYPAKFFLFESGGQQLGGSPVTLPSRLQEWIQNDHNESFDAAHRRAMLQSQLGKGNWDAPPGPPLLLLKSGSPLNYWVGVHIPLHSAAYHRPLHGTIVWQFPSLWTNSFFFNYKSWLIVVIAVVAVSVICWLPLIRDLTRTIAQLTQATGSIAEGHFDLELPTSRRDELGQLSASIHRMAERLSDFVHGQRRFLSDIAHELCSPIARIQVALGILEQRAPETLQGYVADVQEEAHHMSNLVNELLAFSKAQINTDSRKPEAVNLLETIQHVLQREAVDDVAVTVAADSHLSVLAYSDYLFRSLSNIVRNAIRYAGHAGPIHIAAIADGPDICISVTDQGPGLPPAELEQVFKPFYRPEFARTRETGGTGLGLAIVKSCIEACGGTVRCRNNVPHGLIVEMRLTNASHHVPHPVVPQTPAGESSPLRT